MTNLTKKVGTSLGGSKAAGPKLWPRRSALLQLHSSATYVCEVCQTHELPPDFTFTTQAGYKQNVLMDVVFLLSDIKGK